MPTYVVLLDFTEQGVQNFEKTVDRYEAAEKQFQEAGASFKDVYWTLGQHDILGLVEADDDETVAAVLLKLGAGGNVRTTTMRAFSPDEMRAVIEKAGS